MGTRHDMPPRGYYTASEVGRLAGVSGKTIGQWARHGFVRSSRSGGRPRIYSFQDVGEAIVVHLLRKRGAKWPEIRSAIEELRTKHGTAWPLSCSEIATRGSHIVEPAAGVEYDVGKRWQRFFDPELKPEMVSDLLRRGGWATEQTGARHIEVNPERLSGRPTIKGTRIAAEKVASIALAPGGRGILKDGYDLRDEEIDDAVRWWQAVQQYEAA